MAGPLTAARRRIRLGRAIAALVALLGCGGPASAGTECVIFEWAVPPGMWSGSGDSEPSGRLMTASTRWEFRLDGCSLAAGTCAELGSGSTAFQDGEERTEWYTTGTVPTVQVAGNDVTYSFMMNNAALIIVGQPVSEDLDWSLTATLPAPPSDSPSAAELTAATTIAASVDHRLDAQVIDTQWAGTATDTVFTSCTVPPAELTIEDVVELEGSPGPDGATSFVFTVTRDHNAGDVSARVDTLAGSATSTEDFTAIVDGSVDFATGGSLTDTVKVDVAADAVVELDEGFQVVLSEPVGATLGDDTGDATITNDDTATLGIDDVEQTEGTGGTTEWVFTITLDAAVDVGVSVDADTTDGTAQDESGDNDYESVATTLSFGGGSPGETESVAVQIVADHRPERDEDFQVLLSAVSASGRDVTIGDGDGRATILDDDDACSGWEIYRQPFDSPPTVTGHDATAGVGATFENVVDGGGAQTTLSPGPVSGVRLWGFGDDGGGPCALDPAVPFDVVLAADGGGVPGAVLGQRLGVTADLADAGGGVTRVDLVFEPFEGAGVGWISVSRPDDGPCVFRWLAEDLRGTYDDQVFTPPATAPDDAYFCLGERWIFADGFESGDVTAWSNAVE